MSVMQYNPYNVDGAEFDIRDTLTERLKEYYDNCFEDIAKYDTEAEWEQMCRIRTKHKRIRLGIWNEVKRMVRHGKSKFSLQRALAGVDNPGNFHRMCKNKEICAYFFTRPLNHNMEAKILLDDSIDNIRAILKLPLQDKNGRAQASVVNAQLKIFEMLQDRVLGQTVQRIQQHTVQERKEERPRTIAEIDAELKALESQDDSVPVISAVEVEG